MVGHKLTVEQVKTTDFHPRDQPSQRHFRRIGCARKHAFAKKRSAHRQPVEPAHQFTILPALDAMC